MLDEQGETRRNKMHTIETHGPSRYFLTTTSAAEDLATYSAMMPSSERIESTTAFVAFLAMLIWHPVLLEIVFKISWCLKCEYFKVLGRLLKNSEISEIMGLRHSKGYNNNNNNNTLFWQGNPISYMKCLLQKCEDIICQLPVAGRRFEMLLQKYPSKLNWKFIYWTKSTDDSILILAEFLFLLIYMKRKRTII